MERFLGLVAVALCACTPTSATKSEDAAPGSGSPSECDPAARHDAASFAYTASCALAADDAGAPLGCQEWWEGTDGDWTPFLLSCLDAGGAITTVRCTDAGLGGVCALAPSCTEQTRVFYYGSAATASGRQSCAVSDGATFSP